MTRNVKLDVSTMEMTIDGEKVTGKCRSEPNYGLSEDLDDRSIRVGTYFHYNLSKSVEEQSVIVGVIQDIINDENIPYIFKLYNIDNFISKLKDLTDFKENEKYYILERLSQLRLKS